MRFLKLFGFMVLGSAAALAQASAGAPKPLVSFDKSAMDTTADPCDDFYQYACGGWRASNPIPSDKSRWGRFDELREYNLNVLHSILEAAAKPGKHSANEQKVGDFYSACMDEKAADTKGIQPLQPWFTKINAVKSTKELVPLMAELHHSGISSGFGFAVGPDLHNSTMNIANVDQGGLTLSDRDYYVKQDAKMTEVRAKYVEHLQKMFELAGDKPEKAAAEAKAVMNIETQLAEGSLDRVSRRDPKNRDHKMSVAELQKLAPDFDFPAYFAAVGSAKFDSLNVGYPEFFQKFDSLLKSASLDDWKTYLRWRVLRSNAPLLSKGFVDENFAFNGKYLSGQQELEARWKRCTALTDASLGEALGPLYVAKYFPPDAKKRMDTLVADIEGAMGTDVQGLEWMTPETKKAADAKLGKVTNKIGYPQKWKDYSTVKITRNDLIANVRQAQIFEVNRNIKKLGKPVDRSEWGMTPPTVNAYYSPAQNNINFPAGILQPPFFSNKIDDAVNYGAIGVVIGHELTHGFDDQGRKFDGDGNFTDWWGPKDNQEFESRAKCLADEYSSFVSVKDDKGEVHLNGRLTLGENTADNGGLKLGYMALTKALGPKMETPIDGFTPAQRFYIGYAQIWCENVTPQRARELALVDPHSPGQFRVIGAVRNAADFGKAFNCKPGAKMVPQDSCHVW